MTAHQLTIFIEQLHLEAIPHVFDYSKTYHSFGFYYQGVRHPGASLVEACTNAIRAVPYLARVMEHATEIDDLYSEEPPANLLETLVGNGNEP